VGNTMALNDEQKDFLSNLEPGRVILSTTGINKPLQVQIKELISTTTEEDVSPADIREIALSYYGRNYKRGLIQGLEFFAEQPSNKVIDEFLQGTLIEAWFKTVNERKANKGVIQCLRDNDKAFVLNVIVTACYVTGDDNDLILLKERLNEYLSLLEVDSKISISLNFNNAFRRNIKK